MDDSWGLTNGPSLNTGSELRCAVLLLKRTQKYEFLI